MRINDTLIFKNHIYKNNKKASIKNNFKNMMLYKSTASFRNFVIAHVIHIISLLIYYKEFYTMSLIVATIIELYMIMLIFFSYVLYNKGVFTFVFIAVDKPFVKVKKTDLKMLRVIPKKKTFGKTYTDDGNYMYSKSSPLYVLEAFCKNGKYSIDTFESKEEAILIKQKLEKEIRLRDSLAHKA